MKGRKVYVNKDGDLYIIKEDNSRIYLTGPLVNRGVISES